MKHTYLPTIGLALLLSHTGSAETPLIDTSAAPTLKSIRLEPTLHLRLAHGQTTNDDGAGEFGGHDPSEDNFNIQGLEVGANIYLGDYVEGFTTTQRFQKRWRRN